MARNYYAESAQSKNIYWVEMKEELQQLVRGEKLGEEDAFRLVSSLMSEESDAPTDAQIAAYLTSTASRPIGIDELTGAVRALRKHMVVVETEGGFLLDTCGTGGSGLSTFSTSTLVGFVCAAAGQAVAKHGNRAASSKCGSADFLEALGAKIDLPTEAIARCIKRTGFGFMFAPLHHPATKRVVRIRKELGFRTIFNFLGPLSNPAGSQYQLLGVSDPKMLTLMAETLAKLGTKRALVVRGNDGLDEITICERSSGYFVESGQISEIHIDPEEFGLKLARPEDIRGEDAEASVAIARQIIAGGSSEHQAKRDIIALNAGAALFVCEKALSITEGVQMAHDLIESGKVQEQISLFCEETHK